MRFFLYCLAVSAWAQSTTPSAPPPPAPNANWQSLLAPDTTLPAAATRMITTEQTVAASLPLPPSSGRPTNSPDWEATGSACAAFVNIYKLSGDSQYLSQAKKIADNFITWNDWLVANRNATIPYQGWGPATREAEFGCPAVSGYFADDLWDTSGALRCLLKYAETDPNPAGTPYFARAKKVIDAWPYFDRASGNPAAPALNNDGPYAAYGLRFYRKSNDPCEVRYVKNTNIAMSEQLFRVYRITQDASYLDAATRALYAELWDVLTHSNFGYNSFMIYDDISNAIYAKTMVPANAQEVNMTNGQIVCKDRMSPPTDSSCWDHVGFEGFEVSVIEQLINSIDASKFPVASTVGDVANATAAIMANYHSSAFGNAAQFNWSTWLPAGLESPTYVTAYNCAQRFSSDPVFYSQCLAAFAGNPNYSMDSRGDVLYSLVPDAVFTPNLAQGAIVNAASSKGGSIAPGELVTVYGAGMGNGAQVLFDGTAAPVIYASQNQTNAIVPYAVDGQASTEMQIVYKGTAWKRYPLTVSPAAPGLFNVILNQDTSPNSGSNPAARGSTIVLFATGAGQTSPPGIDGAISSVPLPVPVLQVTVTIGGQPAQVMYAGAAPEEVSGVLQINCVVPDTAGSGSQPVVVTVGTAQSPAVSLSVAAI